MGFGRFASTKTIITAEKKLDSGFEFRTWLPLFGCPVACQLQLRLSICCPIPCPAAGIHHFRGLQRRCKAIKISCRWSWVYSWSLRARKKFCWHSSHPSFIHITTIKTSEHVGGSSQNSAGWIRCRADFFHSTAPNSAMAVSHGNNHYLPWANWNTHTHKLCQCKAHLHQQDSAQGMAKLSTSQSGAKPASSLVRTITDYCYNCNYYYIGRTEPRPCSDQARSLPRSH